METTNDDEAGEKEKKGEETAADDEKDERTVDCHLCHKRISLGAVCHIGGIGQHRRCFIYWKPVHDAMNTFVATLF